MVGTTAQKKNDGVNHPGYYNRGNIEVIDFIEDQDRGFHLGNCVKYICRAGRKDPEQELQDLGKAMWYLSRWMELVEKEKTEQAIAIAMAVNAANLKEEVL